MNKVLHARIEKSLAYYNKISIHALDGKSLRDQIMAAGFEDGDEVVIITKEFFDESIEFKCKSCGLPSLVDPSDQVMPIDYCHPEDHGETEE